MTRPLTRVTADADPAGRILFYVAGITASTTRRTLTGEVVAFGGPVDDDHPDGVNVGLTSAGPLRVARRGQVVGGGTPARGLSWPDDLGRVKLTEEHDRSRVRGHMAMREETPDRVRGSFRVTDDADGDAALAEAHPDNRKRDGLSIDVVNATVVEADDGGSPWLVGGDVVAVGQVGIPAFWQGSRIDSVAASATPATEGKDAPPMTPEQRARLAELLAKNNRTTEEESEFATLSSLAVQQAATEDPAPAEPAAEPAAAAPTAAVAASLVPRGIGRPNRAPVTTGETALDAFCDRLFRALQGDAGAMSELRVSAALTDVTHSAHAGDIGQPAWSAELWSGVQHEQEFVPLLASGTLTSRKGQGWRWVTKPVIADYAGDKAAIPSAGLDTELAEYTAARMAVGHDIDRAFYDFPDGAPFIAAYVEAVRESWSVKLDGKVEAYIAANAADSGEDVTYDDTSAATIAATLPAAVLKAVGLGRRSVKRAKMGSASFVVMHDDLFDSLLDMTNLDVPAFLDLFGIAPENFVSSSAAGFANKVVVGAKMAATVRTLPGSPIRVSAQDIAKGGIDEAFFGYWAIEKHASTGIQYVDVTAS